VSDVANVRLAGLTAGRLRRTTTALAILLAVVLAYLAWPSTPMKSATVYFPRTVHIYKGGDVDVLGIKIGTITGVKPEGDRVRVDIRYRASQKIPAGASAVILTPTLVADRVVQLTPAYTSGPVLADKATIPLQRTGIPLELDQVFQNLNDLAKDVGPNGANANGSLSRLFTVTADNLDGQGTSIHDTLASISDLSGTLNDNKDALFRTVRNLQAFTDVLAQHDQDTRAFTSDLAKVGQQLDGDRTQLAAALRNLNEALGTVTTFVRDNKQDLESNVQALAGITTVLAQDRDLLGKVLDVGALGATNYTHVYDPASRSFDGRFSFNNITSTPALFACSALGSVGVDATQCLNILKGFGLDKLKLPTDILNSLGSSSASSSPATSLSGLLGVGR
jgi:phospholipid/cholesterol/gamma-HCH transport system substrate-binding protein